MNAVAPQPIQKKGWLLSLVYDFGFGTDPTLLAIIDHCRAVEQDTLFANDHSQPAESSCSQPFNSSTETNGKEPVGINISRIELVTPY